MKFEHIPILEMYGICSNLTIKTPERRQLFLLSHLCLVFRLLTLNKLMLAR